MRIALAVIGFASIIFLPFWIALVCMIALSVRYRAWEVIVLGLCMDLIWHPHGLPYFMIASIIIVWALEPVRVRLLS